MLTGDGTEARLRRPVAETVTTADVVVALLDVPTGTVDNRNVVGVETDGRRRWEIDPIRDDPTADQPYVGLSEREDGVWVHNPMVRSAGSTPKPARSSKRGPGGGETGCGRRERRRQAVLASEAGG